MEPQNNNDKEERSLGELFSVLTSETGALIRQEVALAQSELTGKAVDLGKNISSVVIGGAIGYAALLSLMAAIIAVLSAFIPVWASALIVAGISGGVAAFLISRALAKLRNMDLTPDQTVKTLKEDARWLKKQMS